MKRKEALWGHNFPRDNRALVRKSGTGETTSTKIFLQARDWAGSAPPLPRHVPFRTSGTAQDPTGIVSRRRGGGAERQRAELNRGPSQPPRTLCLCVGNSMSRYEKCIIIVAQAVCALTTAEHGWR